ncbi:E3 ubiquitin-protein ligase RNF14-like [Poecilia reticulata]|uniref:E3 ubiquitin-protein ligase RNF14-like n=1 Tax=Poecilia reticulata TaxID=8081 RepID=UPI0004A455C8|nr:PREDICTED: E3 ubiquitin-protein ligase RNF14-like [Poecilia reticulata]
MYCPRPTCGSAVILEKSSPAAMCSVCSFAFCVNCKNTYHGRSKCHEEPDLSTAKSEDLLIALPKTEDGIQALLQDYASGSKPRRRLLENRYGRKLLGYTVEMHFSDKWIATNTKPCPHCFTPIHKDGGCNLMFCTQCKRDFTWQ